jgi:hypothetical protein
MTNAPLLHENATAYHLGLLRIWVFGLWAADVFKDPITELARMPMSEFHRVGVLQLLPMSFWNAIHNVQALRAWWGVVLVFLVLSTLGAPFYRLVAAITCILLTFYQGMIFGFSHVTHAELAALYMTYILAVFPSADALAIRRLRAPWEPKPIYQAALLAAMIMLLATYMLTGVRRVFAGGVDIFTNGTILGMIAKDSVTPDHLERSVGLWALESPMRVMMLQIGFVAVTVLEILSLACISSRWFRWSWLAAMLAFHVLSWPLLQTLFVFNILLIWILLIDWDGMIRRLIGRRWGVTIPRP